MSPTQEERGAVRPVRLHLRAYVACGTQIILDEDAVVTSVGDC